MNTTKVVVRLLDSEGKLLGWCEVQARVRGDGQLWSPGPVIVIPTTGGIPACISLHWADVNVETKVEWPQEMRQSVVSGQELVLYAGAEPIMKIGDPPKDLPMVAVGKVSVGLPPGSMGAKG